jgi:hypothetical protein
MNSELAFTATGSTLMSGIVMGILLTVVCTVFSLFVDFLFGRRADREHVLSMGIICTVFSITQAYYDTSKWFDLLQGLSMIVILSFGFGYLKSKYESARNYLTYTVWNFSSKKEM